MTEVTKYFNEIQKLYGKTVAIVYIFEGDDAPGYVHYESWKSNVISSWMYAVEELHCIPLIIDIRTFVEKAMNHTLPHIDYVINLNNGTVNLSTLGVVPSICSFFQIPCIPCDTVSVVTGEHKRLSNMIASQVGIQVPRNLSSADSNGITRHIGLGSSFGIVRGINKNTFTDNYMYQEFIQGFDMTTPILYNPLTESLEILPSFVYIPENNNVEWFLDKKEKSTYKKYKKEIVKLDNSVKEVFLNFAKILGIKCYCRIDTRLTCESYSQLREILNKNIMLSQIYFLEINPMPTIRDNINFHVSIDSMANDSYMYKCYSNYKQIITNATPTGFVLSNSMLSLLKSMHEKQLDYIL